jgi:hypothetical protein
MQAAMNSWFFKTPSCPKEIKCSCHVSELGSRPFPCWHSGWEDSFHSYHFSFWWYWSLNSRYCACYTGALLLEPYLWSIYPYLDFTNLSKYLAIVPRCLTHINWQKNKHRVLLILVLWSFVIQQKSITLPSAQSNSLAYVVGHKKVIWNICPESIYNLLGKTQHNQKLLEKLCKIIGKRHPAL